MIKIVKIGQGVLVILMISNILFLPKTISNCIKMTKNSFHFEKYELKKEKIDTVIGIQTTRSDGSEFMSYKVLYSKRQKSLKMSGDDFSIFNNRSRNMFKHFEETILNGYYNEGSYQKNDSIWIWENKLTSNEYAFGKDDVLKIEIFTKRLFINLFFIVIAIFSFYWIIKNIKFK